MLRLFLIKNFYSTEYLAYNRNNYSLQTCYRKNLTFLKFRKTLTQSIANRLVIHSQYYKSFLNLRRYYISLLRANFCKKTSDKYSIYKTSSFENRAYKLAYKQYQSLKDLDNALLWKSSQINTMFGIRTRLTRKKKQFFLKETIHYIWPKKRLLFVWKWLAISIRCLTAKKTPKHIALIAGFDNFLNAPDPQHFVISFKLKIYKIQAVRSL